MNRKEFKLLMENWRSDFISESLEEEVHEEIKESELEENSSDDNHNFYIASDFEEK